MDQHHNTSDERHREIARSMGFDDHQMKIVEMYLALSHKDRAELREYLEVRYPPKRDAQPEFRSLLEQRPGRD